MSKITKSVIDNTIKNIDLFNADQLKVIFDMLAPIDFKSGFKLHNYVRDTEVLPLIIEKSLDKNDYTEDMIIKYLELNFIKKWKEIKEKFFDLNYELNKSRIYSYQIALYEMENLRYKDFKIIDLISKNAVDKLQDNLKLRYS